MLLVSLQAIVVMEVQRESVKRFGNIVYMLRHAVYVSLISYGICSNNYVRTSQWIGIRLALKYRSVLYPPLRWKNDYGYNIF